MIQTNFLNMIQQYTIEFFELITRWSNDNQGMLTLVLFCTTLLLGWLSGIFSGLRRRPKFCIDLNKGPTFVCTFGTGAKQDEYDIHRTGIALYLRVANVGSAAANIESVAVGYLSLSS